MQKKAVNPDEASSFPTDGHRSDDIGDHGKMAVEVTGLTKLFGILADPIHHVKTPQALNRLLRKENRDGIMVPFHVTAEHVGLFFKAVREIQNFGGMVVTVPHKRTAMGLCDHVSENARSIGAVNVVRREADGRLVGDMLDGQGFVAGLNALNHTVRGKSVYMVGAGGAANAIAFALAEEGIQELTIFNRTVEAVDDLFGRLIRRYPQLILRHGTADPSGHYLVINATSLGLRPSDALPLCAARLHDSQIVADIIMDPVETELLKQARERGCTIYSGSGMLAGQVHSMLRFLWDDRESGGDSTLEQGGGGVS